MQDSPVSENFAVRGLREKSGALTFGLNMLASTSIRSHSYLSEQRAEKQGGGGGGGWVLHLLPVGSIRCSLNCGEGPLWPTFERNHWAQGC